jgi:hypothetical protein
LGADNFVIPLVGALDTVALEADLVDVLRAAVGVCGEVGFPNFSIDAAVGVGREDGVGTPIVSSGEVGSNSGAISAGTKEMSFLQFSKKESGASAVCLSNAVVVKGASSMVCDKDSPCLTCLGVDGSDKG